ncbi:5'-methylthioadenosine nucleosidase [Salinibacter altiplanensis]|uniref:phosphorylase family protein n=1 Tax=Salinibacter altiplanensis TaxID=1803181 RepID=UPI000C9ED8B9|nr:5'-methylthioadenosine nucleosidase [Salinibacter altiplanensis]
MLGVIFSTPHEAAPFVEQYTGERFGELEEGAHLETEEQVITVVGPGKIKAALGTRRLLHEHDLDTLVHAGGAVALADELEVGAVVGATFVLEGDRVELEAPDYPRMPLDSPFDLEAEGTLVSQDHVREDADEPGYWERIADMRDATGYAVAYVAAQHGTPCHIAKGITGRAHGDAAPSTDQQALYRAVATCLQKHMDSGS